jgi:hypothetical protein
VRSNKKESVPITGLQEAQGNAKEAADQIKWVQPQVFYSACGEI